MQPSRENEKAQKNTSKVGAKKTASSRAKDSLRQRGKTSSQHLLPAVPAPPSMGPVLTQEEFRARVARKAFELYEKRRALTEVDDWVEAERLVKLQLLEDQRGLSV
jgi:hypothetical protein